MRRIAPALLALLVAIAALVAGGETPRKETVRQLGRTVSQWKDDLVQIVVSYRWTGWHLDDPWMLLDTRISAVGSSSVDMDREDFSLETPSGATLQLPSQAEVAKGMPDMQFRLDRASASSDPLNGYFPSAVREERLGFFAVPGKEIVFSRVGVDNRLLASGWLFFRSPTGKWEAGTYTLVVKNKVLDIRLPLTLPSGERKDGSGSAIPW